MSLQEKFTSKQLTIIIIAICAVFIFLGIFTMVIGNEAESSEKYVTVDSAMSAVGNTSSATVRTVPKGEHKKTV